MPEPVSKLPDVVYIQAGRVGNDDLFVNRTPQGAVSRPLGQEFESGAMVGVYRLEKIVRMTVGVVQTPMATSGVASAAVPITEIPISTH